MSAFSAQAAPVHARRDDIFSPLPKPANLLGQAPSVSSDEAALSRLLGRGLQQRVPGSDTEWLLLPDAGPGLDGPDPAHCLVLDTGSGPVYLNEGARFLCGVSGIDGSACEGDWPQWMVGAMAGRMAGTPLAGLAAIRRGAPAGTGLVRLQWRLHDETHAINAIASASARTWCALLTEGALTPLRMALGQWLPLALNWPLVLAAHRLPAALFQTLAVGDIIVPDSAQFDCAGLGHVTLGRRRFQAIFSAPQQLELLKEEQPMHTDPIDDVLASDAPEPGADGDAAHTDLTGAAVDVTLRFELGALRMTLDALRTLGPGSVLELHGATPHAIAIVCGAQQVGRGEVVDVDGRLGVRIHAWGGAA